MSRDPRVDPQPGDVLDHVINGKTRRLAVDGRTERLVDYRIGSNWYAAEIESWQSWAPEFVVVHVAPTPEFSR